MRQNASEARGADKGVGRQTISKLTDNKPSVGPVGVRSEDVMQDCCVRGEAVRVATCSRRAVIRQEGAGRTSWIAPRERHNIAHVDVDVERWHGSKPVDIDRLARLDGGGGGGDGGGRAGGEFANAVVVRAAIAILRALRVALAAARAIHASRERT